jgi:hypothetical protein
LLLSRAWALGAAPAERKFGTLRGKLVFHDDFDGALPEELAAGFEGQQ